MSARIRIRDRLVCFSRLLADPLDAGPHREGARGARERDNAIQEHQAHAPAEERRRARPPAPPLALRARRRRALTAWRQVPDD